MLINTIYMSKWDLLILDNDKKLTLNKYIMKKFIIRPTTELNTKKSTEVSSSNQTPVPTPVLILLSKIILSAYILQIAIPSTDSKVNPNNKKTSIPLNFKKLYTQASKTGTLQKVEDILHIKEAFPALSADKVRRIIKVKNSNKGQKKQQKKLRINIMTKGPLRK